MKIEQSKIPLENHRRYAIDQKIKQENPLTALLSQGKIRPPSLQQSSSTSVSHLSLLLLSKESTHASTSFCPPKNLSLDHLFSFEILSKLEQAADKFFTFLEKEKDIKYKGAHALSPCFTCTKKIYSMHCSIEAKRRGIQQG